MIVEILENSESGDWGLIVEEVNDAQRDKDSVSFCSPAPFLRFRNEFIFPDFE